MSHCKCNKMKDGGMANLKKLFKGKDTYAEEVKEARAIKSGKITPEQYAKGEKMEEAKKMAKGGVAKKVTKEMEYDYKTGKKSFSGSTAKRDAHAEKEGKIVAKHLAYDESKGMKKGGSCKGYAKGGYVRAADGVASRGKTRGKMC